MQDENRKSNMSLAAAAAAAAAAAGESESDNCIVINDGIDVIDLVNDDDLDSSNSNYSNNDSNNPSSSSSSLLLLLADTTAPPKPAPAILSSSSLSSSSRSNTNKRIRLDSSNTVDIVDLVDDSPLSSPRQEVVTPSTTQTSASATEMMTIRTTKNHQKRRRKSLSIIHNNTVRGVNFCDNDAAIAAAMQMEEDNSITNNNNDCKGKLSSSFRSENTNNDLLVASSAVTTTHQNINTHNNKSNNNIFAAKDSNAVAAAKSLSTKRKKTTTVSSHIITIELNNNNNDNGILVHGIVENLHQVLLARIASSYHIDTNYYYWTCIPSSLYPSPNNSPISSSSSLSKLVPGMVKHIQQKDRWSCGYRNYQMLLSAILPRLAMIMDEDEDDSNTNSINSHINRIYRSGYITRQRRNSSNTTSQPLSSSSNDADSNPLVVMIPSLQQIQQTIEKCWYEGFDPDGSYHYNNKIRYSTSKIGAMEVCNLLWYHSIDACVVQFMGSDCYESQVLFPYFLRNYFDANNNNNNDDDDDGACFSANTILSNAYTESISGIPLQNQQQKDTATTSASTSTNNNSVAIATKIPLYLQWEGHSVTIIGIEVILVNKNDDDCKYNSSNSNSRNHISSSTLSGRHNNYEFNLLVLDPMKTNQNIRNGLHTFQWKLEQLQRQTLSSSSSSTLELPNSVRLPWKNIRRRDLQIIVCTLRSMTDQERFQLTSSCTRTTNNKSDNIRNNDDDNGYHGRVITAAEGAVMSARRSKKQCINKPSR